MLHYNEIKGGIILISKLEKISFPLIDSRTAIVRVKGTVTLYKDNNFNKITVYSLKNHLQEELANTNIKLFSNGDKFISYKDNEKAVKAYVSKNGNLVSYAEKAHSDKKSKNPDDMSRRFFNTMINTNYFTHLYDINPNLINLINKGLKLK